MLRRVTIKGIELPKLYLASTEADTEIAMRNGIPFIVWKGTMDTFIKVLFRPALEKMFPYIDWNIVLGRKKKFETTVKNVPGGMLEHDEANEHDDEGWLRETTEEVADIAGDYRYFAGPAQNTATCSLETYMGDISSSIDLDVLQKLQLLPQFLGDIVDCIRANRTASLRWNEGYNKKLSAAVGVYNRSQQLPNLIILDVSGSIPRGISATMIQLIDTLRAQVNADLIITSSKSKFYAEKDPLPSPEDIRRTFGLSNESCDFEHILRTDLRGKEYGYIFSFGDYDTPSLSDEVARDIKVNHVVNFHTCQKQLTGYVKWTELLVDKPTYEFNTDWCEVIRKNRR